MFRDRFIIKIYISNSPSAIFIEVPFLTKYLVWLKQNGSAMVKAYLKDLSAYPDLLENENDEKNVPESAGKLTVNFENNSSSSLKADCD